MENTTNLTPALKDHIATTVTWARYAAIISLVNLGLSLIQLIMGFMKGNPFIFFTVFAFVISTVITLVLAINLLRYSTYANTGITKDDSHGLYQAIFHLRIYFVVIGVLFLIAISLLTLLLLFGVLSAFISLF